MNESAGKRRSARTGLRSQYYRLKNKRGANKATIAVAHSILVIAYHIIKDGTEYHDLGANHLDERRSDIVARHLVRRLRNLGHKVTLEPAV